MSHTPSITGELRPTQEPLAVIGVGCRLPGEANSPAELWRNLMQGVDCVIPVPPDRWQTGPLHDPDPRRAGRIKNAVGGFIKGVDEFDADFFGYFPAEAVRMDPQQRLLVEVAHEAMEDAGLRYEAFSGTKTSVFIGSFFYDYLCLQADSAQRGQISPYVAMGIALCSISNRISYDFNLKGPSVTLDTACSASLTAIHLACRSIWSGEADMAIAGGVNLLLRPEGSIVMSKAGFLSPDGRCKAFDASANGYVRSEGVGLVILKPLAQALQGGDRVYATVLGTACNQDGHVAAGFTVPNGDAQKAMLEAAYAHAQVEPSSVSFVEAHGPGTPVGDPIETRAIGTVLGRGRASDQELLIGSIKTNVGHLEGASGVAGFIKATLALKHRTLPGNLHFRNPNPNIDFAGLKLKVPVQPTSLGQARSALRAGVNSFGAGGTNTHIVLEEFCASPDIAHRAAATPGGDALPEPAIPLVLSARSPAALAESARRWQEFLRTNPASLRDLAHTAGTRRSVYAHGLVAAATTKAELIEQLATLGQPKARVVTVKKKDGAAPKLAFLYSGQGGQWINMGRRLWETDRAFRTMLDQIDGLFHALSGQSVRAEIFAEEKQSRLNRTEIVQPAIMAIQVALTAALRARGIVPAAVAGHSIGEVAAAYAAGSLDLPRAVQVIYHRSRIQARQAGAGGMLAVGLPVEEGRALVREAGGILSIAAVNGPAMLALAGEFSALDRAVALLEARGVFNRRINVEVPYHSEFMTPLRDELVRSLGHVQGKPAEIPLYSTVSGRREDGTHLGGDYWFRNVREPVLFTDTVAAMLADGFDTLLEVGPHPVVAPGAKALVEKTGQPAVVLAAMRRGEASDRVLAEAVGALHLHGLVIDWDKLIGRPATWITDVPKHPWLRQRHWFELPELRAIRTGENAAHPFVKAQQTFAADTALVALELETDAGVHTWFEDHQVNEAIVVPGTAHLEMAHAAAKAHRPLEAAFLQDVRFESALIVPEAGQLPVEARLELLSSEGDYAISSRPREGTARQWRTHSRGRIAFADQTFTSRAGELSAIKARFAGVEPAPLDAFYAAITATGLAYGPAFRCVRQLWHQGHQVLAELTLPDSLRHEAGRFHFHPALLDACLHAVFIDVHRRGNIGNVYLPDAIRRVKFHAPPVAGETIFVHHHVTRHEEASLETDLFIYRADGTLLAELHGLEAKRLHAGGAAAASGIYQFTWREAPLAAIPELAEEELCNVLVVGAVAGMAGRLVSRLRAEELTASVLSVDTAWWPTALAQRLDRRTHIVFLWPAELSHAAQDHHADRFEKILSELLQLGRGLVDSRVQPRVYLVTRGATAVVSEAAVDLGQAPLIGFARVLHNECPNLPLKIIDLDPAAGDGLSELISEIKSWTVEHDEVEIAWRSGRRWLRVVQPLSAALAERQGTQDVPAGTAAYAAEVLERGRLDSVRFRRLPLRHCAAHEVDIEVVAAGVNFQDATHALGQPGAVETSPALGLEVAGRIVNVGRGAGSWRAGDEVIARVAQGFSGRVFAPSSAVVRKPAKLSFAQAAAIPVAGITSYYSLCHLGRVEAGDTVLIHSAAGGVGLSALHIARWKGATVIATAGTKAKRDYLRGLGVEHVFDSRALGFYDEVMAATGGRGVDLVLNNLTGSARQHSLRCLAPFGRFLEIGQSEAAESFALRPSRLAENISYQVVGTESLAAQKPSLHLRIFQEVAALYDSGRLPPPEITTLPMSRLAEGLKAMTRAQHVGKYVLTTADDRVTTLPPDHIRAHADRAYLVTGGTNGFGLELAAWLARKGAGALVLASRSGVKTAADQTVVDELRRSGVKVHIATLDISHAGAVDQLFAQWPEELPPLAGIIHSAAVLDDASLANMTTDRFHRAFGPKALGAWNLHAATVAHAAPLDFFLMLSSISSVLGITGQTNYASANYFLDSLAQLRRSLGLSGTSVNLGVLGAYAGMSSRADGTPGIMALLESHGLLAMNLRESLGRVELALAHDATQWMVANFDWARYQRAYPHLARDARLQPLFAAPESGPGRQRSGGLRATLETLGVAERPAALVEHLAKALGKILDSGGNAVVPADTELARLALDSLMLTQLQNWILRNVDVNYPIMKLLKGPRLDELAGDLCRLTFSSTEKATGHSGGAEAETEAFVNETAWEIMSPWIVRARGAEDAPVRMICFHSMGAGASLFTHFLLNPPPGVEVIALQLPGRENRRGESLPADFDALLAALIPALAPWLDRPFFFWGHSFGGILAWEVAKRLRTQGLAPFHLVISGTIAPHLIPVWQKRDVMMRVMVKDQPDDYLLSLSRYIEDPEFMKRIIPVMRADYVFLKSYAAGPVEERMAGGITAFSALQDDMVYPDETAHWRDYTEGKFDFHTVDGDHWFLNRNKEFIGSKLQAIAAAGIEAIEITTS